MSRRRPTPNRFQRRLVELMTDIEDRDFRDMLIEVVAIEGRYRSAKKFPTQQIRDVLDNYASLLERKS
jgi:hypothetical protein